MIKSILNSIDLTAYTGVTNVVQNVEEKDILLLPCSSEEQLNDLLDKNLKENFFGLLVSPFKPKRDVKSLQLEKAEIKELEEHLINHYYPLQAEVKYIGVTGTNGKTSVCWMFSEIGKALGKQILYMGTPGVFLSGKPQSEKILTTTPSYLDLRKLSHRYKTKFDAIVLEVSSHALAQERLKDITLTSGAWTNFTQDHLDFHKTMEEYFEAKKKIISLTKSKKIITPQNSTLSGKLGSSTVAAISLDEIFSEIPPIFSSGFTRENLEVALSLFENTFNEVPKGLNLSDVSLPPGRFQVVSHKNKDFIVDYAHTPDALVSLLSHVKEIYSGFEVITVFGCGGDRDKTKRPQMGKAAESGSDKIIVTSDNPRSEEPLAIIQDVLKGVGPDALFEVERKKAIQKAFDIAGEKSVIVVAGKGHEDYQEINGVRHKMSDFDLIGEVE